MLQDAPIFLAEKALKFPPEAVKNSSRGKFISLGRKKYFPPEGKMKALFAIGSASISTSNTCYGFKELPTLYLLDHNKRVQLKDAAVEEIEKSFE